MDQTSRDSLDALLGKETWTVEDYCQLNTELTNISDAADEMCSIIADLQAENPDPKGAAALKIGIGQFMICRFTEALESFNVATDNKDRRWFQAQSYKSLRQYDKAIEEFNLAQERGLDQGKATLECIECQVLKGELDDAQKALDKIESAQGQTAQWICIKGMIQEANGFVEPAAESYEQALDADEEYIPALFRLAYLADRSGDDEEAMELYHQCLHLRPTYVSVLMNLAVLCSDLDRYDEEILYLRRVLKANPRHARARLFLKDAESSKTMFFDEDQVRQMAQRNAILETPVSDFELSVRARNCLKKMDIRTLGDLVRTPESRLLEYKNFGETSLREIREMLASRGLRVGQALEEGVVADLSSMLVSSPAPAAGAEGVGATPLDQVELSVRARKALEGLSVRTLGELASKSEAELLACRNFGQTSLNEIRQRLTEYGMRLKENI